MTTPDFIILDVTDPNGDEHSVTADPRDGYTQSDIVKMLGFTWEDRCEFTAYFYTLTGNNLNEAFAL